MPTILLVEDEAPLAVILERVLTQAGYQVVQAADGHAAPVGGTGTPALMGRCTTRGL